MHRTLAVFALGIIAALFACGGGSDAPRETAETLPPAIWTPGDRVVTAELVSERPYLVPGETAWLGVAFSFPEDWYMYWKGYNDSGLPPEVELWVPDGFTADEPAWPAPTRKVLPGNLLDHVYPEDWVLLLPVEVPADAPVGATLEFSAIADWLVCREACIPEGDTLFLRLPVVAEARPRTGDRGAGRVTEARARVPRPAAPGDVTSSWEEATLTLAVPGALGLTFFPAADSPAPLDPVTGATAEGDRLALRFAPATLAEGPVSGILEIRDAEGAARHLALRLVTPVVPG
jgi:DsbC/DsbD-like thiol-disulfide interchange protein